MHKVIVTKTAQKDINKLDELVKKRIFAKIKYFAANDDAKLYAVNLVKSDVGSYRWRVGVFRVVFDIDGDTIVILRIRHRRDVYKK